MTREQLIDAVREISAVLTTEINQSGDNDDRFRALRRAEKLAVGILSKAEAPSYDPTAYPE